MSTIANLSESKSFAQWLISQAPLGVPGLIAVGPKTSQKPLLVIGGTHGHEYPTHALTKFLYDNQGILTRRVYLAVGNGPAVLAGKRRVQVDGNRVPADFNPENPGDSPDLRWIATLVRKLRGSVQHIFDGHTTDSALPKPQALGVGANADADANVCATLPTDTLVTNVAGYQFTLGTVPHAAAYQAETSLEYECGQNEDEDACRKVVVAGLAWLAHFDAVTGPYVRQTGLMKVYEVQGAISAPDTTFRVVSEALLPNYAAAKEGDVLLEAPDGRTIKAQCDLALLWGPSSVVLEEGDALPGQTWWYTIRRPDRTWSAQLPEFATKLS